MTDQLGTLQALSSTRWGLVFPLEVAYSSSRSHWFSSLQHLQKHTYIYVAKIMLSWGKIIALQISKYLCRGLFIQYTDPNQEARHNINIEL